MKTIDRKLIEQYFTAIEIDGCNRSTKRIDLFKQEHKDIYEYLHSFYHLRSEMYKDIDVMRLCGRVEWFTLTFDNKRDKNLIATKRKQATRFLNDLFLVYEMVEEFGEDNGRYHIHGFGVFKTDKGFTDFVKWPCRQKIETLSDYKLKQKVRYLTQYAVKDLPRRRRSKTMVYLSNWYLSDKKLKAGFKRCFECRFKLKLLRVQFAIYNKVNQRTSTT